MECKLILFTKKNKQVNKPDIVGVCAVHRSPPEVKPAYCHVFLSVTVVVLVQLSIYSSSGASLMDLRWEVRDLCLMCWLVPMYTHINVSSIKPFRFA